MSEPMICPQCDSAQVAGMEIRGIYDGVLYWFCLACDYAWPREFGGGQKRLNAASIRNANEHRRRAGV